MKKFWKIGVIAILGIFTLTGCKTDDMEDIEIVTTSYPIEYITERLYGDHALVTSIYPDGTNIREYVMTPKQLSDFSKKDLFIYNGLSDESKIAIELLDRNKNLKIIDSASVLETSYGMEELWLNPSHLLMMSQNIRKGFDEYLTSTYLKKEVDERYEELKVDLSELDANIKLTAANATNKTIVVSNNTLKYLNKYGFNVISLEEDGNLLQKTIDEVKTMIQNKKINYIFILEYDQINSTIQSLLDDTDVEALTFRRLDNIKDEERNNKKDYLTIMKENIELLQKEVYQ